jgi:hypothetical protein
MSRHLKIAFARQSPLPMAAVVTTMAVTSVMTMPSMMTAMAMAASGTCDRRHSSH